MAAPRSNSLKDYLKRYESNSKEDEKKKTKKKKQKAKPVANGVLVVDEDPVWAKPVVVEDENDSDSADEEKPQVDEDIEVKRMKRLEEIRARRAYNAISEDGSGWVTLSQKGSNLDDSHSDLSPARRRRTRNDTPSPEPELKPSDSAEDNDMSLPRQRGKEDIDLSPPRRGRTRNDTPSPEHGRKVVKENVDLSPPRRGRARNDTPSPKPEKGPGNEDEDLSPPRKRQHIALPEPDMRSDDISPPRRRCRESPNKVDSKSDDLSPPRKNAKQQDSLSGPKKQRKTGLITGQEMREEIAQTKKQDWMRLEEMDPSMSGRNAEPVYRDRIKGNRVTKEEFLKSRKKVEEKPKEMKLEWGKGLAQKREAEARLEELESEKDKPFARTRDDPELDRMLKETVRWGDPMAHLVKKKQSDLVLPNLGDDERMRESGFVIPQDIPNHSWIKRGLDAAPNRYGIKPGRHWDGVDRSNGYEKEMFKRTNEKRATEMEAYLWSVSDM